MKMNRVMLMDRILPPMAVFPLLTLLFPADWHRLYITRARARLITIIFKVSVCMCTPNSLNLFLWCRRYSGRPKPTYDGMHVRRTTEASLRQIIPGQRAEWFRCSRGGQRRKVLNISRAGAKVLFHLWRNHSRQGGAQANPLPTNLCATPRIYFFTQWHSIKWFSKSCLMQVIWHQDEMANYIRRYQLASSMDSCAPYCGDDIK